ncbi:MAG: aldose epimerase family protein [Rikenellaceae bacterium]
MKLKLHSLSIAILALFAIACNSYDHTSNLLVNEADYDTIIDGKPIKLYTLTNGDATVQLCNYGGRIVSFVVPDKDGEPTLVVWQERTIEECLNSPYQYAGVLIGRFANRIGNNGKVTIEGEEYQLSLNSEDKHSHGGFTGFTKTIWDATQGVNSSGEPTLTLHHLSPDGDEGYPGNLDVTVVYTLQSDNELRLDYTATTDAPTIINLTSHPFFNLHGSWDVSSNSHLLTIHADRYTPSAQDGLLTGEILTVEGTPLDFRTPHAIGERVNEADPQLLRCHGYDTNHMLNNPMGEFGLAAELYEPSTGIALEFYTDQPALQFYGGYYQGKVMRDRGIEPGRPLRYGVALEAQNCPNAPHRPTFPNSVLMPGETYTQSTSYKFVVK